MLHRTPFFFPWLYPNLTWRVPTSEKELYLTFDDGPVPGPTDFVLETLRNANVKATFFCIGDNIKKNESIFQKLIDDKHSIGNHTFNHLAGWKTDLDTYITNVAMCDQIMEQSANNQVVKQKVREGRLLFRPPYGRIKRSQIKSLPTYDIIMWDVLTYDYSDSIEPEACLKNSIRVTRPGSIIVFHDSFKAEKNMMYVLPRFIDHFKHKGYTFKTLHS